MLRARNQDMATFFNAQVYTIWRCLEHLCMGFHSLHRSSRLSHAGELGGVYAGWQPACLPDDLRLEVV